jgi:alcohol dehydrogenase
VESGASFQHVDPPRRVLYGRGTLSRAGEMLEQLGCRRALLLAGTQMASSPLLAHLQSALGERVAGVLGGITEHSGPEWVRRGTAMARERHADAIVSIGGGSTIDTGKCIALVALLGGDIADHRIIPPGPAALNAQPLLAPALPHLCIPTTGSGSETTPGAGLRSPDGHKWIFWHPSIPPQAVLLDPEAAATTPWPIAAASSMNSLAHAVEALYSASRQPMTDAFALAALERFGAVLPRLAATPGDIELRGELQQAWLLAGLSIANARVALHHAMCHCLGARCGLSHGVANAVMLAHVMRFNAAAAAGPLARVGQALGAEASAEAAVRVVDGLRASLGLPARLRDVGVDEEALPLLAQDAMAERATHFNPVRVSRDDVLAVYRAAW